MPINSRVIQLTKLRINKVPGARCPRGRFPFLSIRPLLRSPSIPCFVIRYGSHLVLRDRPDKSLQHLGVCHRNEFLWLRASNFGVLLADGLHSYPRKRRECGGMPGGDGKVSFEFPSDFSNMSRRNSMSVPIREIWKSILSICTDCTRNLVVVSSHVRSSLLRGLEKMFANILRPVFAYLAFRSPSSDFTAAFYEAECFTRIPIMFARRTDQFSAPPFQIF